jgi:hypothetical protein
MIRILRHPPNLSVTGITDGYVRKKSVEQGIEEDTDEKDEKAVDRRVRDRYNDDADDDRDAYEEYAEGTIKVFLNVELIVTAHRASIDNAGRVQRLRRLKRVAMAAGRTGWVCSVEGRVNADGCRTGRTEKIDLHGF